MKINHGASTPSSMQNPMMILDSFARDAILAWYLREFAAVNAIINVLCAYLTQLASARVGRVMSSEYDAVFAAIHRWRLNWIPVLQMQKYPLPTLRSSSNESLPQRKSTIWSMNKITQSETVTKKSEEVKVAKLDEQDQKVKEEEQSEKIDEKVTEN